jgi:hypothetical protein
MHISFVPNLPTRQDCERPLSTTIKSEKVCNLYMIEFFSFHTFSIDYGSDTDHEIYTVYHLKNEICTMSPNIR